MLTLGEGLGLMLGLGDFEGDKEGDEIIEGEGDLGGEG